MADCNIDEVTEPQTKSKLETIGDLESIKRAFFNKQYDEFETLLKSSPYKFYKGEHDNQTYSMDFIAKNYATGLAHSCDVSKYAFVSFECNKVERNTYEYKSYWIVNTSEDITKTSNSNDFEFEYWKFTETDVDELIKFFMNKNDEQIAKEYVH
jgi:hypothetical protein